jgi:L-fuconolactonase
MPMRIDAHVHFWRPSRGEDILILQKEPTLRRDHLPDELAPLLHDADVEAAVAIQSAPEEAETRHLLDITRDRSWVLAVIGWADLASPAIGAALDGLCAEPKFVGLRAMLHRLDDPTWIARSEVGRGLQALAARGLTLDVTARPEHLTACVEALGTTSDLTLVLNHGGIPPIRSGALDEWQRRLREIALYPNLVCKFSGLLEEADGAADQDSVLPVASVLLDAFSPNRLLWGSNWPVCNLVGGYGRWRIVSNAVLDRLGVCGPQRDAILGGNAERIYDRRSGGAP